MEFSEDVRLIRPRRAMLRLAYVLDLFHQPHSWRRHARVCVSIGTAIDDETKGGKPMLAKASVNVLRSEPVY